MRRCRKRFSEWEWSFHLKAVPPLDNRLATASDRYLELSDRSEIWQAHRQHCCRCESNFKTVWLFKPPISRLRDCTRSYDEMSSRILKREPTCIFDFDYTVTWIIMIRCSLWTNYNVINSQPFETPEPELQTSLKLNHILPFPKLERTWKMSIN